jgi:hypothetical protein
VNPPRPVAEEEPGDLGDHPSRERLHVRDALLKHLFY